MRLVGLVTCALWAGAVCAFAQMPNARAMSGVPRVVDDLPSGSVVVRVVRDELGQVVRGVMVELEGSGRPDPVETDADGRAEFSGLAAGLSVRAVAFVDGQRMESQRFEVPAQAGVRLLLVAGGSVPSAGEASEAGGAAVSGPVTLGGDSRVVVQLDDGRVDLFFVLEIVNPQSVPVTADSLVFEAPAGAPGMTVLEGSSPQAEVSGRRVVVRGPFAPGATPVQFVYSLPVRSGEVRVRQPLPVTLQRLTLYVERAPGLTLHSTQVGDQREMASEGRRFIVALGPAVKAGDAIAFQVSGAPYRRTWPRNLALGLAAGVLMAGAWGSWRRQRTSGGSPATPSAERRDRLFDEVLDIDRREQAGELDQASASARRAALVGEVEAIDRALDHGPAMSAGSPEATA